MRWLMAVSLGEANSRGAFRKNRVTIKSTNVTPSVSHRRRRLARGE